MPKFTADKNSEHLNNIFEEGRYLTRKSDFKKILEGSDYVFEDKGTETAVIRKKEETDHVTAINYSKPELENLKEQFYIQKILSVLFPHNFPEFVAATNPQHKGKTLPGTVRNRINKTKVSEDEIKYPFSNVQKSLSEMGIEIYFDPETQNYGVGEDKGEYFLDTVKHYDTKNLNLDKILHFMRSHGYSERDQEKVKKAFDRLIKNIK